MYSQSVAEWLAVVEHEFSERERRVLAGLYNTTEGCDMSLLDCQGLEEMLRNLTTPVEAGSSRVYLSSHFHRAGLAVSRTWPGTRHRF
jgi:hypothetical protein